ncbi:MAG: MgtC/SapB family protein [Phycisphaerales bacterium]|nr:MgtC/SapB family protein [Phycisphaerales bacterium]
MPMPDLLSLALATALGLLIGLQREWADQHPAGRTFALITLFGALSGLLSRELGDPLLIGAFIVLGTLIVVHSLRPSARGGITSMVASVVMFCVGIMTMRGFAEGAVVVTGVVALLLQWKHPLRRIIAKTSKQDVQAVVRLVLIGMVILPVLPNEAWGPYGVLNPFRIWLMVVLIVGISLSAWIAQRLFGQRSGTLAAGLLGGVISSTATTVGIARQSQKGGVPAGASAAVVVIASTIVIARVLFEILIVAAEILPSLAPPLLITFAWLTLLSIIAFVVFCRRPIEASVSHAPSNLRTAVIFGLLYGGVLFAVAAAKEYVGQSGLFAVAALSGLTDMDAITLSTAQLVNQGDLAPHIGWRLIITGVMSNLVFKTVLVASLGGRAMLIRILPFMVLAIIGAALVLVVW